MCTETVLTVNLDSRMQLMFIVSHKESQLPIYAIADDQA